MTRAESARVARSIPRSGRRSLRVVIGYERIMLRCRSLGIFTLEGLVEFLRAKRATVFSESLDTVGIDTLERRIRDWGGHWPRPLVWYRLNHHDWRPDGKPWAFTLEEFF